jgi:predicted ribosome quality control (RQC) complex YloA/Tae2 family protein
LVGVSADGVLLQRGEALSFLGARRTPAGLSEVRCEDVPKLARPDELHAWVQRGTALVLALETSSVDRAREAFMTQARREAARLVRRETAIESDLERGQRARADAEVARLFVVAAAKAPRGAKALSATDWSGGEPVTRELLLDPAKPAKQQLDAIFDRARRLASGAKVATARLFDARAKRARLEAFEEALKGATVVAEMEELLARLRNDDPALLPAPTSPALRKGRSAPRTPYRAFVTPSAARILVGKSAADNDTLTVQVARPHDLWLHVRDGAGSHVVVPLAKGEEASPELVIDAAHLAAHFSSARDEAIVLVTYTPKRYVRKRRGSPAGLVELDREKVLTLRVEQPRLEALLAREERLS